MARSKSGASWPTASFPRRAVHHIVSMGSTMKAGPGTSDRPFPATVFDWCITTKMAAATHA